MRLLSFIKSVQSLYGEDQMTNYVYSLLHKTRSIYKNEIPKYIKHCDFNLTNFNLIIVCRTVRRGGGVSALFKYVYQCKQVSFDQYLSFEYLGI